MELQSIAEVENRLSSDGCYTRERALEIREVARMEGGVGFLAGNDFLAPVFIRRAPCSILQGLATKRTLMQQMVLAQRRAHPFARHWSTLAHRAGLQRLHGARPCRRPQTCSYNTRFNQQHITPQDTCHKHCSRGCTAAMGQAYPVSSAEAPLVLHVAQQPTTSSHIAGSVLPKWLARQADSARNNTCANRCCSGPYPCTCTQGSHLVPSSRPAGRPRTCRPGPGRPPVSHACPMDVVPLSNCDGVGQGRQGVGWQSGVSHLGEAGGPVLLWTTSPTPTQAKRAVVLGHHKHKLCRSMCAVVLVQQCPSRSKPMPQPTTAALKGGECRAGAAGCVTRTQRWYQPSTFLKS